MKAPLDCGIEIVRGTEGHLCGRMGRKSALIAELRSASFTPMLASSACKSSAIAVAISMPRNHMGGSRCLPAKRILSDDPLDVRATHFPFQRALYSASVPSQSRGD